VRTDDRPPRRIAPACARYGTLPAPGLGSPIRCRVDPSSDRRRKCPAAFAAVVRQLGESLPPASGRNGVFSPVFEGSPTAPQALIYLVDVPSLPLRDFSHAIPGGLGSVRSATHPPLVCCETSRAWHRDDSRSGVASFGRGRQRAVERSRAFLWSADNVNQSVTVATDEEANYWPFVP